MLLDMLFLFFGLRKPKRGKEHNLQSNDIMLYLRSLNRATGKMILSDACKISIQT